MTAILPLVEGDGDLQAVPELIRRIAILHEAYDVSVLRPHKRGDLPKVLNNFERFFEAAVIDENSGILWIMDFDCDFCDDVIEQETSLRDRANRLRPGYPFEVCLLVKEYESLFLHDPKALQKTFPTWPPDASLPTHPEEIRDAKGWISKTLPKGIAYKPTTDQKRITAQLDLLHLRKHSPSFGRLEACVLNLISKGKPHA